ncbi:FtsX-like permease family protein [Micromonospora sp. BRA006-A]|nr:FtsX-like permease family protein [Micromonospora sp. BRA006-A]
MAALARRRELALLQLVGVTRRQIRGMVRAEQAGLLGTAVLIGAAIAVLTLAAIVNGLTGSPISYVPPLAVGGGARRYDTAGVGEHGVAGPAAAQRPADRQHRPEGVGGVTAYRVPRPGWRR